MEKNYLLTPGPTPVLTEALLSMAKPIIHHRTPQFQNILKEVEEGLKYVFQTENDVLIFASSGTGAMEGAVQNLLSPGDKALVVRGGKFGERWGEICEAFGIEFIPIDVQWGEAVDPNEIDQKLKENTDIKAVFTTLCETSTGVVNDIKAISEIVRKYNAILVVDAISGLGVIELKMDKWCIDVVVTGSQKGLMIPPGLSFVSLSPKAWKLVERTKRHCYYFDFLQARKLIGKPDTPFTPAISLIIGLAESLKRIKEEGLDKVLERHRKLASAVRKAVEAIGLKLYAPTASSDAVTPVLVPEGIDGTKLVKTMRDKYGVTIADGQGKLKGKVFRIATMGYITQFDVIVAISALEIVLSEMGYQFEKGKGVKACEEVLSPSPPAVAQNGQAHGQA